MNNIWQFLGLTQETIGRGRYFVANITASFGLPIAVSLLMSFFFSLFEDKPVILYPLIVLFIASFVFALVVHIKTSIRRVRDIGIAQSWWVLAIIPLVNIPFAIFLCLKKGGSRSEHFSLRNNPLTEQFRGFFSYEFSKPFIIICFGVIMAGVVYAWFAASNLKNNIDVKIEQRENEIAYEIFGQSYEQAEDAYDKKKEDYEKCVAERTNCLVEYILWESYKDAEQQALNDQIYQELNRIKEAPLFRSFISNFFKNFSFGWWGIIALVAALLINIMIVLVKFVAKYVPILIRTGGVQTKLAKTNIGSMPAFQRYLLFLMLLIFITLMFVLIKL